MGLGHFDKDFVKKKKNRKRGTAKKYYEVFTPIYSQNYILDGNSNPKMSKNQDTFFDFKIGQGRPPLPPTLFPSCALVSVAEYASIFLNMPKYP